MAIAQEPHLFTVDDFFALIPDGQKADLIDGVIYVASPDSPHHNELAGFIQFLMDGFVAVRMAGKVYSSRVAFVLSRSRAPEPDIAFLAARNVDRVKKGRVSGPPDIAVEVVSLESRERDYILKRQLYERAKVPEYWIIDPLLRRAEFYRLRQGEYMLVPLEHNGIFRSEELPGFWLNVDWLFQEPPPNKFECLQMILALQPEA